MTGRRRKNPRPQVNGQPLSTFTPIGSMTPACLITWRNKLPLLKLAGKNDLGCPAGVLHTAGPTVPALCAEPAREVHSAFGGHPSRSQRSNRKMAGEGARRHDG